MAILVFGLTGSMGSGKSVVAARLRERGLPVVDADLLSKTVVAAGSDALAEITQTFGPSAIDKRGGLNRRRVAELVFADSLARERLEAIIHPRVRALARSEFAELERAGEPLACYEAALLFETGRADEFRPVVTVSTSEARCVARIMARDGSSEAQARDRLRAQLPLAQKVARADYVVDNDGTLSETRARTDEVLDGICWAAGVAVGRYPRNAP